jgi:hypothetical protein
MEGMRLYQDMVENARTQLEKHHYQYSEGGTNEMSREYILRINI